MGGHSFLTNASFQLGGLHRVFPPLHIETHRIWTPDPINSIAAGHFKSATVKCHHCFMY